MSPDFFSLALFFSYLCGFDDGFLAKLSKPEANIEKYQ
jgi:hypothetical protein